MSRAWTPGWRGLFRRLWRRTGVATREKEFAQHYNWPAKSFEHEAVYSATCGIILCFMFFCISWILYSPYYFPGNTFKSLPGVCFSKVPKSFRARKAIRRTPTSLFCKAALFIICCKENKNENNCKVIWLVKTTIECGGVFLYTIVMFHQTNITWHSTNLLSIHCCPRVTCGTLLYLYIQEYIFHFEHVQLKNILSTLSAGLAQ